MSLRYEFENELNKVHQELIKMGTLITESIEDTIIALKDQNIDLANEVIKRDDKIDNMELKIEKECLRIIARQNPIAGDLRKVACILKIITDLERIADHCVDICKYTIAISKEKYIKPLVHIPMMAEIVKKMVDLTIESYINADKDKAMEVCAMDDLVDDYFYGLVEELKELMKSKKETISQGINLILIVKYLERMADHATNICEWIVYTITGKHEEYN